MFKGVERMKEFIKDLKDLSGAQMLYCCAVMAFISWIWSSSIESDKKRGACKAAGGEFIIGPEGHVCVENLKRIEL
jgi:hypothetical protein